MELPECETCHGNHDIQHPTDEMIGVGEMSLCTDCHQQDSEGYRIAGAMRARIDSLKTIIAIADSVVSRAERAGMPVSEAKFQLNDADDALIKSRTMVHSLSVSNISELSEQGMKLAREALHAGEGAIAELQFRRRGLALSVVFILILAAGFYLKIRELDKKDPLRTHS
jgi:hypothetical protein